MSCNFKHIPETGDGKLPILCNSTFLLQTQEDKQHHSWIGGKLGCTPERSSTQFARQLRQATVDEKLGEILICINH